MMPDDYPDDDPADVLGDGQIEDPDGPGGGGSVPGIPDEFLGMVLAAVANYAGPSGDGRPMIRVPVARLLDAFDAPGDEVFDAIAELEARGLLGHWEAPRDAGVSLSPLAAANLGLRANSDGTRWEAPSYGDRPRCVAGRRLVVDADLDREEEGPMEGYSEERAMSRVRESDRPIGPGEATKRDVELMREDVDLHRAIASSRRVSGRELMGIFADAIGYHDWSMGQDLPSRPLVLYGVHPWPQPGQGRGPQAANPREAPSPIEAEMGKGSPYRGACWTCKGLPLKAGTTCDVCDRGPMDWLTPLELRAKIAAARHRPAAHQVPEATGGGTGQARPTKGGKSHRKARRAARVTRKELA